MKNNTFWLIVTFIFEMLLLQVWKPTDARSTFLCHFILNLALSSVILTFESHKLPTYIICDQGLFTCYRPGQQNSSSSILLMFTPSDPFSWQSLYVTCLGGSLLPAAVQLTAASKDWPYILSSSWWKQEGDLQRARHLSMWQLLHIDISFLVTIYAYH